MILGRTRLIELIKSDTNTENYIAIENADGNVGAPRFDIAKQVGIDSIDLRIGCNGYRIKCNYDFINSMHPKIEDYFEEFSMSTKNGYVIRPGETIVVGTVERILLYGDFFGMVTGRTRYARMGISVHCSSNKFQAYSDAIVSLHLTNNNRVPIKIFPYQPIAQMIVFEISGYPVDKRTSEYREEAILRKPLITDKELKYMSSTQQDYISANCNIPTRDRSLNTSGDILQYQKIKKSVTYTAMLLDIVAAICEILRAAFALTESFDFILKIVAIIAIVVSVLLIYISRDDC